MCHNTQDIRANMTAGLPSKYGAIYDKTIQWIKPHHLEKAHARNIVMIFSHPLNFHFDSRADFRPTNGLSSPVIIVPICVCASARVCAWQTASLAAIWTINRLCPRCHTSRGAGL